MKKSSWFAKHAAGNVVDPKHRLRSEMDTLTQLIAFLAVAILVISVVYPLGDGDKSDDDPQD